MVHFDGCLLGDVDGVLIWRRKDWDVSLSWMLGCYIHRRRALRVLFKEYAGDIFLDEGFQVGKFL